MEDEADLRETIKIELDKIANGRTFPTKDYYRELHRPSVENELNKCQKWIKKEYFILRDFFANGTEIDPLRISPKLVEVTETWQKDLFRLARYTWSLPYSKGYGRRLRFLILDGSNNKLIGIFGMQSPPLDFPARDVLFNYPSGGKYRLINESMDIYTLGAIPPYNKLLAGKLVALSVTSNEVRSAYRIKYGSSISEILKENVSPELVFLTTTSAFGRSSLYNRLKFNNDLIAQPLGFTKGYGSFHLSNLYPRIRKYLEEKGISTHGGFGVGPRIVWQTFMRAQQNLGIQEDILKHGVKREVFIFPLIKNRHARWEHPG